MSTNQLKELKIPKYEKNTSYNNYIVKLLWAASTRGRMKQVLEGEFMDKMSGYTTTDGVETRDSLNAEQIQMEEENNRA